MDIYDIAGMDAGLREVMLDNALRRFQEARRGVADVKTGIAVGLLREMLPEATRVRFRAEGGEGPGTYVVLYSIDEFGSDETLHRLAAGDEDALDALDRLMNQIENELAGAVQYGAEFADAALAGSYVLDLTRVAD
jgi:hypothetical protein